MRRKNYDFGMFDDSFFFLAKLKRSEIFRNNFCWRQLLFGVDFCIKFRFELVYCLQRLFLNDRQRLYIMVLGLQRIAELLVGRLKSTLKFPRTIVNQIGKKFVDI